MATDSNLLNETISKYCKLPSPLPTSPPMEENSRDTEPGPFRTIVDNALKNRWIFVTLRQFGFWLKLKIL